MQYAHGYHLPTWIMYSSVVMETAVMLKLMIWDGIVAVIGEEINVLQIFL